MWSIQGEALSYKNTKAEDKPNEDIVLFEEDRRIGLLLDGVSRDRENGLYPLPSPAAAASDIFSKELMAACREGGREGPSRLKYAIEQANAAVKTYNEGLKHRFPAGTVGICFTIEEDRFVYGYIGDCHASILRSGMMRTFTECQTRMIAEHRREFTSDEIRFEICNHISHPYGYGVWDGNPRAMDFTKYGEIQILPGDVIVLCSDGLEAEVKECGISSLLGVPLEELFAPAPEVNLDDRSILRLRIG